MGTRSADFSTAAAGIALRSGGGGVKGDIICFALTLLEFWFSGAILCITFFDACMGEGEDNACN